MAFQLMRRSVIKRISASLFTQATSSSSYYQQHKQQHNSAGNGHFHETTTVATFASAAALITSLNLSQLFCEEPSQDKGKVNQETWQQRQMGFYENRLRSLSHPQKVFNYFASIKKDGESYMRTIDFIFSLLPYFPNVSENSPVRTREVIKERIKQKCPSSLEFFRMVDTNGDGLISYQEYIFFLMLLSTPESQFHAAFRMFDEDGNNYLDFEEFQRMLDFVSSGVKHRMGKREKSHRLSRRVGLVSYLFGPDGTSQCSYDTFKSFLQKLHYEVMKLEFFSYEVDQNDAISLQDFACVMVNYAHSIELNELLERIKKIPPSNQRVSFQQFCQFDQIVSNLTNIQYAINLFSQIQSSSDTNSPAFAKSDFKRAVQAATNINVPDFLIDLLYYLFDANNDGRLDNEELLKVLQGRFDRGLSRARFPGDFSFINRMRECWVVSKA